MGIWTKEERIENLGMNPVAANLMRTPGDYPWSSAHAHRAGKDDRFARVAPLLVLVPDWQGFLPLSSVDDMATMPRHEGTDRSLGSEGFVDKLEAVLARTLRP